VTNGYQLEFRYHVTHALFGHWKLERKVGPVRLTDEWEWEPGEGFGILPAVRTRLIEVGAHELPSVAHHIRGESAHDARYCLLVEP
jgi:hypothetical protein